MAGKGLAEKKRLPAAIFLLRVAIIRFIKCKNDTSAMRGFLIAD
jgi:hypothetical protein